MSLVQSGTLVKEALADQIKEAIIQGRLQPGQRVVESAWAVEFGVAQASVREAINLLILEGFLVKKAGRSARVPHYSEKEIARIYEVRGALEGLAARLAAIAKADLTSMETALEGMEAAMMRGDAKGMLENDLAFHLALAQTSGNPILAEMLERLLRPLFAFVMLRMLDKDTASWDSVLGPHREMIYLIRESDPVVAGQFVQHSMTRFMRTAHMVWLSK